MSTSNVSASLLAPLPPLLLDLESVCKDLHALPQLSMEQTRTARIAAEHRRAAEYEVTTGIGMTAFVGLPRNRPVSS